MNTHVTTVSTNCVVVCVLVLMLALTGCHGGAAPREPQDCISIDDIHLVHFLQECAIVQKAIDKCIAHDWDVDFAPNERYSDWGLANELGPYSRTLFEQFRTRYGAGDAPISCVMAPFGSIGFPFDHRENVGALSIKLADIQLPNTKWYPNVRAAEISQRERPQADQRVLIVLTDFPVRIQSGISLILWERDVELGDNPPWYRSFIVNLTAWGPQPHRPGTAASGLRIFSFHTWGWRLSDMRPEDE